MDARTQAVLLLAVGGVALRLGFTDAALAYVKPSMQPALVGAGLALLVLGGHGLLRSFRGPGPQIGADHHHDRGGSGVAWLLLLPVVALVLVSPPPLGSFAAGRQSSQPLAAASADYPPLPEPVDGAVPLTLREYTFRALYDQTESLDGVRVRLLGFVTPATEGGYRLTRFTLNCCAADATALSVEVRGDGGRQADTWLEVDGFWQARPDQGPRAGVDKPPLIVVEQALPVPAPSQPYEY